MSGNVGGNMGDGATRRAIASSLSASCSHVAGSRDPSEVGPPARPRPLAIVRLGAALLLAISSGTAASAPVNAGQAAEVQEPPAIGQPTSSSEEVEQEPPASAAESTPESEAEIHPCRATGEKGQWIDAVQRGTEGAVCRIALWFDGLFGDDRAVQERDGVFGWMLLSVRREQGRSIDPGVRFRAKAPFPMLERRLSLLVGRAHEDDLVRDDRDAFSALPQAFREAGDQDWLLGLGWSPIKGDKHKLGFDGGAKIGRGLDPYVKAYYRSRWFVGDKSLVRTRPVIYWRDGEDGFGASTAIDFDRILGDRFLTRLGVSGVHDRSTQGIEWRPSITLFQGLRAGQAIGYQISAFAETDAPVAVERYTALAIYRRRIGREWLYLDLRPGISRVRETPEQARRSALELTVGVELRFGDWP